VRNRQQISSTGFQQYHSPWKEAPSNFCLISISGNHYMLDFSHRARHEQELVKNLLSRSPKRGTCGSYSRKET
jgi:hypothetical protein